MAPEFPREAIKAEIRVGIAAGLGGKDFVHQQVNGIHNAWKVHTRGTQTKLTPRHGTRGSLIGKYPDYGMPSDSCRHILYLSTGNCHPRSATCAATYQISRENEWHGGRTETAFKRAILKGYDD